MGRITRSLLVPDDPLGTCTFEATVHDRNANVRLLLVQDLRVEAEER